MNKLIIYIPIILIIILFITKKELFIDKKKRGFDNIPIIMYINLEYRTDRRKNVEKELSKLNYPRDKIIRIDAIKKDEGRVGCCLSHMKALEMAQKMDIPSVLIIEDDFIWSQNIDTVNDSLQAVYNFKNWDVCVLSCSKFNKKIRPYNSKISIVSGCQSTTAYIVKKHYIPILLNFWKSTLINNENIKLDIDQSWKILQKKDRWISTNPFLAKQKDSYSDISKKMTYFKNSF